MTNLALAIHGGAGKKSPDYKKYYDEREEGLTEALSKGYEALKRGAHALSAVEKAVMVLEDNPYFNAGRGSTLNQLGKVNMDASMMEGKTLKSGAVCGVQRVKNPVQLARLVMDKTKHVFLAGKGAMALAETHGLEFKPESYFIVPAELEKFKKSYRNQIRYGTVGAVALDKKGNLAAATSTGGMYYTMPGRIGDSCIIGAGCYANNRTCAVSSTGHGEIIIRRVAAHSISTLMELKGYSLQRACEEIIHHHPVKGDMGVIALDASGKASATYNTDLMSYGWKDRMGKVKINP